MVSIIPFLASSLGRRDEKPNILLAEDMVIEDNQAAIEELIHLCQGTDNKLAADAIKVIYEVGRLNPQMLNGCIPKLISLLKAKQNRLQWGSMIAISTLTGIYPKEIYRHLGPLIDAMQSGSVITKDHGVKILVNLSIDKKYTKSILPILLEFIQEAPINQFTTYVERINSLKLLHFKEEFVEIIRSRLPEFEAYPAKTKKLLKVLQDQTKMTRNEH